MVNNRTFRGNPIYAHTKKDGVIVIYCQYDMGDKYKWYSKHGTEDGNFCYMYGGSSSSLSELMASLNNSYHVRKEGWA